MKEKRPRKCDVCGKHFKPMTDASWAVNKRIHDEANVRHLAAMSKAK